MRGNMSSELGIRLIKGELYELIKNVHKDAYVSINIVSGFISTSMINPANRAIKNRKLITFTMMELNIYFDNLSGAEKYLLKRQYELNMAIKKMEYE